MKTLLRAILVAQLVAQLGSGGLAAAQTPDMQPIADVVIELRAADQATADQRPRIAMLSALRGTIIVRIARLRSDLIISARAGQLIKLKVSPVRSVIARAISIGDEDHVLTWRGEVADPGRQLSGDIMLTVGQAGTAGTIEDADGRVYLLRPLPGDETAIIEIEHSAAPRDVESDVARPSHPRRRPLRRLDMFPPVRRRAAIGTQGESAAQAGAWNGVLQASRDACAAADV